MEPTIMEPARMEPARTEPSRMEPARMELAEELQNLCRSCQISDGPARQIYLVVRRTCQTSRMIRFVTFGCLRLRWLKFPEKKCQIIILSIIS